MRENRLGQIKAVHRHAWLWEPLEEDATFVLRTMFGTKTVYLEGKLTLCFADGEEPWRGLLLCTERAHHAALIGEFPVLSPHPILGKWLYLPEAEDQFETIARRLVQLARRRDPRLGVVAGAKSRKKIPIGPGRRSPHR